MQAEWIWIKDKPELEKDYYGGFKSPFKTKGEGRVTLKVSCDSVFAAYVNGELVGFSGCADYPHYKLYDEMDITEFCKGDNELYVIVWYFGENSSTYINASAGFWFEIEEGGEVISASSEATLSRRERNFVSGFCKVITVQLGYSFSYDNSFVNTDEYIPSVKIDKLAPVKRKQKNLVLSERAPVTYEMRDGYVLVDMGKEVAGYPDFEFYSPCEQDLLITFGEHLNDGGKVLRSVGGREFSFDFKAREGENSFFCPLRRLAGRYLEVHFKEKITPKYIGVRPVDYPVNEIERVFDDELLDRIYKTSVRTLRLCMHEHYEDCPWREQALYALDSRNQMLFGYYAFGEYEYPRSNLSLISHGLRPDGLLAICYPCGRDRPIPFFSLAYILEVCEYVRHSGDATLIDETSETINAIIKACAERIDESGLIPILKNPFWNFYEWSEGSAGRKSWALGERGEYQKDYDIILNAFYVYVVELYNKVAGVNYDVSGMRDAIRAAFYVEEDGFYKLSVNNKTYTQLANSCAALIGLCDDALLEKLASGEGLVPVTLAMKPFLYDALLSAGDKYKDFIIEDIKRVYKNMLDEGATSFWETELGWVDFDRAGSLCHGWSAAPVYYFNILGVGKNKE